MSSDPLVHIGVRSTNENMALLQAFLLVISIICVQSQSKVVSDGDFAGLSCKNGDHINVKNVIFEAPNIQPEQKRAKAEFEELKKNSQVHTKTIKVLCQRVSTCNKPVLLGITNKKLIKINIEFECINTGCPHPRFLDKHVVVPINEPTEKQLIEAAIAKRKLIGGQDTNKMSMFIDDTKDGMEYELVGNICKMKHPLKTLKCFKNSHNDWNCDPSIMLRGTHNIQQNGHFLVPE